MKKVNALFRRMLFCCLLASHTPFVLADSISIYSGKGMDTNLPDIPKRLVKGDLAFEESYFVGAGYLLDTPTPHLVTALGGFLGASYVDSGIEFNAVKHHGMQDNYETNIAYAVRLPPSHFAAIAMRFSAEFGLSYAWGTPSYEDGSYDDPDRRYRFQNYNAYELEWKYAGHPDISLVTRLHHRSGVYGLIAPPHVGSNFFALGLRFEF